MANTCQNLFVDFFGVSSCILRCILLFFIHQKVVVHERACRIRGLQGINQLEAWQREGNEATVQSRAACITRRVILHLVPDLDKKLLQSLRVAERADGAFAECAVPGLQGLLLQIYLLRVLEERIENGLQRLQQIGVELVAQIGLGQVVLDVGGDLHAQLVVEIG